MCGPVVRNTNLFNKLIKLMQIEVRVRPFIELFVSQNMLFGFIGSQTVLSAITYKITFGSIGLT